MAPQAGQRGSASRGIRGKLFIFGRFRSSIGAQKYKTVEALGSRVVGVFWGEVVR